MTSDEYNLVIVVSIFRYEDKIVQLEALESQLKKLYTLAETVAATRRELAIATGSFAAATSTLATTEDSNNLSKALSNLAIVEEKVEKIQHRQADADHLHLFELIKDYVGLMGAVRDALTERQKAFQVGKRFKLSGGSNLRSYSSHDVG